MTQPSDAAVEAPLSASVVTDEARAVRNRAVDVIQDNLDGPAHDGGPARINVAKIVRSLSDAGLLAAQTVALATDRHPSDAAVEAGAQAYWEARRAENDGGPQGQTHAWMRAALVAAYRVDAPRPLLDREAVRSLFRGPNACGYWLENIMDDHEQEAATDAVMELAREMPTREQIAAVLRETELGGDQVTGARLTDAEAATLAGAIVARLT